MNFAAYGHLLRDQRIRRVLGVGFVARFPNAALGIILTLHVAVTLGEGYGAAGLAVAVPPLRHLLPPGTLRAAPGLPAAIASRGLQTFAFFGADTYVPLAITSVRGRSTAVASLAVTAATLAWTAGAWVQDAAGRAWFYKMRLTNREELSGLMDEKAYNEFAKKK